MHIEKTLEFLRTLLEILAVFGITVEIIPIKFSPLRWIGNRLNKGVNDRCDKIQKKIDTMEYENEMRDLRNTKSRIHQYGQALRRGEVLSDEMIQSAFDDLDVYDYYKEKYHYMNINGKKSKINGEVEVDRELLKKAAIKK